MRGIEPDYNKFRPQPKQEKVEKTYKGINKISPKKEAQKEQKKQEAIELDKFCKEWYLRHPTKTCFECESKIPYPNKMNFHHCIPKKDADKYNIDISLNEDILILVCMEDHSKAETNDDFCPKIKAHTEQLKKEYEKYLI